MNKSNPQNPVAALGAILGLFSFWLPWLNVRPNRLLAGDFIGFSAGNSVFSGLGLWCWVLVLVVAVWPKTIFARGPILAILGGLAALCSSLFLRDLLPAFDPSSLARASLAGGAWVFALALYVLGVGVQQKAKGWGLLLAAPPLVLGVLGSYSPLGIFAEFRADQNSFFEELRRHLALTFLGVLVATLAGLPLAIWASRVAKVRDSVLGGVGFLQTIPSLALFGVLLPILAKLGKIVQVGPALLLGGILLASSLLFIFLPRAWPRVRAWVALPILLSSVILLPLASLWLYAFLTGDAELLSSWHWAAFLSGVGLRGIGAAPALLALSLYALLPIVSSTVLGFRSISPGVLDAAEGMGMNPLERLWYIELPLALPFILAGLRLSWVLTLGLATIAALIGARGLGFFVQRGVDGAAPDLILLGVVPVVLLALVSDVGLRWLEGRVARG
jgi:osmoprotectant transport system permease protein